MAPNIIRLGNTGSGASITSGDKVEIYHRNGSTILAREETSLSYVKLGDAEDQKGVIERIAFFPDVVPYANLFGEAGGSPDMSSGTGSGASYVPAGISAVGSASIQEVTEAAYINHGTKSIQVSAATGDGIRTDEITLASTLSERYYSFWVGLRVESGKVRVYMRDAAGVDHPVGVEKLELGSDRTLAIQSGGNEMSDGAARLYVEAIEDGTVFYVDGISVTQSVGPWQLTQT